LLTLEVVAVEYKQEAQIMQVQEELVVVAVVEKTLVVWLTEQQEQLILVVAVVDQVQALVLLEVQA
tara:strand:+ start:270 stop:467 length:198 start_codon:yes stop_codon:yes gene_type:complete